MKKKISAMDNQQTKDLCLSLMKAETEKEVIDVLKDSGFWDNPNNWRFYGDQENNYSSAGNQADEAEAALIEKITNARDAILMNECIERGIDPEGPDAPKNVKEAVAMFFEDNPKGELAGHIREWDNLKRREIARKISVYITGSKPGTGIFPCLNIADLGEGQTPENIPYTILSLGKSIKLRIPFVHGKFNMGGTAALVYCGKNNLQLILSRRNPKLLNGTISGNKNHWGFTIVRREDPQGNFYSSVYKYLAPINAEVNPTKGSILDFNSDEMPIFAKFNTPYSVNSSWGTLVKLYEYETRYKQNVQGSGGLLRPLDLLAPDLGLPYRLHECRYEGKPASFEHQVNGLRVRLFDDKGSVLENDPSSETTYIDGEEFTITVYAFKEDKAMNYRDSDKGIIYTLNGQSQGWDDDRFFSRNRVALGFLRKSLLVIVDCSNLSYLGQERLFINDRVHIRKGPLKDKIEDKLEDFIGNHEGLISLQEERRRRLKAEKVDNSKPLEAVLANVMKHSSALSKIFLRGERLSNAFKSKDVASEVIKFQGAQYPTYFKFTKLNYNSILRRDANINSKCRIAFETDAENLYFTRKTNPGVHKLFLRSGPEELIEAKYLMIDYGVKLYNGIATLTLSNIDDNYKVGEKLHFLIEVTDPMRIIEPPFVSNFILNLIPPVTEITGKPSNRRKPPSDEEGEDREKPGGIKIPETIPIYEKDWESNGFNKYTALKAFKSKNKENETEFTFLVNMDNIYLQHEIKQDIYTKIESEAYFQMGLALVAISIIYDEEQNKSVLDKSNEIEDKIEAFTRAIAPVLIPMIKEFGELDLKNELLKDISR